MIIIHCMDDYHPVKAPKVFLPDSGLLAHLAGVTEYADEGMVAAIDPARFKHEYRSP